MKLKLPNTTHHERGDKKRQPDVCKAALDLAEKQLAQRGIRLNRP